MGNCTKLDVKTILLLPIDVASPRGAFSFPAHGTSCFKLRYLQQSGFHLAEILLSKVKPGGGSGEIKASSENFWKERMPSGYSCNKSYYSQLFNLSFNFSKREWHLGVCHSNCRHKNLPFLSFSSQHGRPFSSYPFITSFFTLLRNISVFNHLSPFLNPCSLHRYSLHTFLVVLKNGS